MTQLINELPDLRKRKDYKIEELVMAAIALFVFKETSRNAFNNDRSNKKFRKNYQAVFGLRLPHGDTVEKVLRLLPTDTLELLKTELIRALLEKRVLHKFRFVGKYFLVAIDGTGVSSYDEDYSDGVCLRKSSKNGQTTYSHYVLEAKLVTSSGLAISLASEWVENLPDRNESKQDCETKAFVRLAAKLKEHFPRLSICLLADGLYPNQTFMQTCQENHWKYIVTLKDDSLKTLQQDIIDTAQKDKGNKEVNLIKQNGSCRITQSFQWIEALCYKEKYRLSWIQCSEQEKKYTKKGEAAEKQPEAKKFVVITNLDVNRNNVHKISAAGRMRWKIENEGFNTQKNGGYALGHKFSRTSVSSLKNYYTCMQIAHLINQLTEHSRDIAEMLAKTTLIYLWKRVISAMHELSVCEWIAAPNEILGKQIRLKE